ncbi:MAG: hypothetical protein A2W61_06480 [Deltaproteobacteria bacterium RIFCSPLOWO2_01_44_7]|nr:MAG: hypothetical protein A2712_05455 [Deltaproteobacteria bacterium RIFCSPHIGHO2_01_FULL_43_49]OGQ14351.1 MAG: hypothetical protein A3D22_04930 [Deltaproteobacteria bacterium RIFCSPHIGHO2_02_FULL_44_53]OGQ27609.1 MAG: hypothetical protein A3D98_09245 [Deltaproteobacteria bacterium RIFCSPHIGHO2_12_FULL_44_21]OGQ30792.1 MAG: hypothetical protein A2979_01340 [Deltaproteobacteria bacterium RIFCSPLOWO2_01_FULL_45_74]OGQ41470.1 MAG: hypothetical protein A2W61_06480 [Deltaproteobacteria bacterium 
MQELLKIDWLVFLRQTLPLLLPLGGGGFLLLVGPFFKRSHRFNFIFSIAIALLALFFAWQEWLGATNQTVNLLLFDRFTYLFAILFLIALILTLLLSYSYLESFGLVRPEYYALLLFAVFGMMCMVAGHDLMVVFLGLEVMSVSVYVLAGFQRSNVLSVEAALKYFLVGAFASSFLLMGIAFIYGATGTTDLIVLHQKGLGMLAGETRVYALVGLSLLAVGLGFKIALVPFHFWAADVYHGAPVIVTTFMATAVKAAGFGAILRVVWALFQWEPLLFANMIWVASVLTMTIGNIAALTQKNLKRMLAYSSIAHAGYAILPLVAFSKQGASVTSSISFYMLAYILMTVGAFAVLIALSEKEEKCTIQDLSGLGTRKPFLAFSMTLFLLSLTGIPPTLGFFGKYYLFLQAVQAGYIWLAVIGVINSVISVYYYLGPVVAMYFSKETADQKVGPTYWSPQAVLVVIWFTFLGVSLFGLFPSNLLDLIQTSVSSWLVAGK